MLPTGLYGVGKAAVHPPALAVLSHTPDGATQTIAWVGKGIVYDTGGLSIKGKVRCWALLRWAAGRRGPRGLISPQALERGDQVSGGSELGPASGSRVHGEHPRGRFPFHGVDFVPTLHTGAWKQTKKKLRIQKKAVEMIKGQASRAHGGRVQGVRWPPVSTASGFQGGITQGRSHGLQVPGRKDESLEPE